MPQIFQVLRCYKCLVFQVHQTKKSNKFKCKLCGENQSIKRHYGIGTAKDCRLHVQKLNGLRQEIDELNCSFTSDSNQEDLNEEVQIKVVSPKSSKWSEYTEEITEEEAQEESNETMMLAGQEVVLEIPKKRFKRPPPSKLINNSNSNIKLENTQTEDRKIVSNLTANKLKENVSYEGKKYAPIHYPTKPKDININKTVTLLEPKGITKIEAQSNCNQKIDSIQCQSNSKTSKWAQFIDSDIDENETENVLERSQNINTHKDLDTLFSLSESYDDLNALLDF